MKSEDLLSMIKESLFEVAPTRRTEFAQSSLIVQALTAGERASATETCSRTQAEHHQRQS